MTLAITNGALDEFPNPVTLLKANLDSLTPNPTPLFSFLGVPSNFNFVGGISLSFPIFGQNVGPLIGFSKWEETVAYVFVR